MTARMDERRRLLPSGNNELNLSPVRRENKLFGVRTACAAILTTVAFERLAFYALAGNLPLFLNKKPFTWESYHAINAAFYFLGLSFVTSLFGGWLADSVFGRFKTVIISLIIYIGGYALMPLLSPKEEGADSSVMPYVCRIHKNNNTNVNNHTGGYMADPVPPDADRNPFDEKCAWLIFIVLTIIAVGTGSFKANIAPFGADQVTGEGPQATLGFFNWYYWSVNIGAFVGLAAITWVEQQESFFSGYLSACICLSVGGLIFLMGACCYVRRPPAGSILTNIFRIIREACRMRHRRRRDYRTKSVSGMVDEADPAQERLSFLDYAKHRHGGIFHDSLVEDVKELKKIICVFVVLILYWLVYFQMQTTFLIQGLHMNLMFKHVNMNSSGAKSSGPTQIVAAWFSLFDVAFLIILLPLFDRVIYPRLARAGYPFGMTKRIALGMVFSMAAVIVAGVVEHFRLQTYWPHPDKPCQNESIVQRIGTSDFYAADMSILWQIPQYGLIGISEVFTSVAGLQFAYAMAPKSMKGVIMGLFYFFSGIGSFLGTAIISIFYSLDIWFHKIDFGNINCRIPCTNSTDTFYNKACHLDYYFFLLAGIELVGLFLFIIVAKVFKLSETQQTPARPAVQNTTYNTEATMNDAKRTTKQNLNIQRSTSNIPS